MITIGSKLLVRVQSRQQTILFKLKRIMKQLFEILEKDYQMENFSWKEWLVCGVIIPFVMVALMCLAGWMDSISKSL